MKISIKKSIKFLFFFRNTELLNLALQDQPKMATSENENNTYWKKEADCFGVPQPEQKCFIYSFEFWINGSKDDSKFYYPNSVNTKMAILTVKTTQWEVCALHVIANLNFVLA